jgi:hypothetical protein
MTSDVDIDFADREDILAHIRHIPATMIMNGMPKNHNSGVYFTDVPYDPINNRSSITYDIAEERGYLKIDFLNLWVYRYIKDEKHLLELMREPDWQLLQNRRFVEKLIHLYNHYGSMNSMPEPIDSIPRLAMFLSVIRPGKRHLIGKTWREVAETVWDRNSESGYVFRKSHAVAYAQLVAVNMNLLIENPSATQSFEINDSENEQSSA